VHLLTTLYRARWVIPIVGAPIPDGGILVAAGRIVAIGKFDDLKSPAVQVIDRSDFTIVPGLVNAHTHLELSEFSRGQPPASFVDWISQLVPRGQVTAQSVAASVRRSIPIGVAQCLKSGVTGVGDISRHSAVSRPLLKKGPLRVTSYGEIQAMAQRRGLLDERISVAVDPTFADPKFLTIALSPHAPYSVESAGYRRCVEIARKKGLPLATHLAETREEEVFLSQHEGTFRDLWTWIGAWDEDVPRFEGGPVRFAKEIGLLDYPSLLAHVNYCNDEELDLLSHGSASVVYCPRTHAFFSHPPHRFREMLQRGINVALGTDSCASSPDLNLLEEMRLLRQIAPEMPAETIWEMGTLRAARAIRAADHLGSLEVGKWADFALFQTRQPDPLAEILDGGLEVTETWIGGNLVHQSP